MPPDRQSSTSRKKYKEARLRCLVQTCTRWFKNQSGLTKHFNVHHCTKCSIFFTTNNIDIIIIIAFCKHRDKNTSPDNVSDSRSDKSKSPSMENDLDCGESHGSETIDIDESEALENGLEGDLKRERSPEAPIVDMGVEPNQGPLDPPSPDSNPRATHIFHPILTGE